MIHDYRGRVGRANESSDFAGALPSLSDPLRGGPRGSFRGGGDPSLEPPRTF